MSKYVLCTMSTKGGTATSLLSNAFSLETVTPSHRGLSESDTTSVSVILESNIVIVSIAEHGAYVSDRGGGYSKQWCRIDRGQRLSYPKGLRHQSDTRFDEGFKMCALTTMQDISSRYLWSSTWRTEYVL
jgi:hypothetical protein